MPRSQPDKDPVRHSERQVRQQFEPRDPVADAQQHTQHSIEEWEKKKAGGEIPAHQQAPELKTAEPPAADDQENPDAA